MQMIYTRQGIVPIPIENDGTLLAGLPVSIKNGAYTKYTATNKDFVGFAIDDSIATPADTQGIKQAKCSVLSFGFCTVKVKEAVTAGALVTVTEGGIKPATDANDAVGKAFETGSPDDYVLIYVNSIMPTIA